MKQFNLYLGRTRQDGGLVTEAVFSHFLNGVDSVLSDGYTVTKAHGYWQGLPEESFIITAIGPAGLEPTVRQIALRYAQEFKQEAVYLTSTILDTAELIYAPVAVPKVA